MTTAAAAHCTCAYTQTPAILDGKTQSSLTIGASERKWLQHAFPGARQVPSGVRPQIHHLTLASSRHAFARSPGAGSALGDRARGAHGTLGCKHGAAGWLAGSKLTTDLDCLPACLLRGQYCHAQGFIELMPEY